MAAQELRTAAVAAKYQLLQPSRHVQLSCRLLNSSVVKLLSASSEARATAVEEEWSRFSLLSLSLPLSPQNFPAAAGVGDRRCISLCFLAIRFHAWVVILTSIKSHFWSSLGHRGHCCVFVVVLGFLGPSQSAVCHFFCCAVTFAECSHARAAAVGPRLPPGCHVLLCGDAHRSSLTCDCSFARAATTLAASQMHLLSP